MPPEDYVRSIRERIGHDLLLVPSALVLPIDDDHRVLLVRHGDLDRWAILGGAIEVDEDPLDAGIREAREEIGGEIHDVRLLGVFGGPAFRVTYPNGDAVAVVAVVYAARVDPAEVVPDGVEVTAARWFSPAEVASEPDLSSFARMTLDAVGWDALRAAPPRASGTR